MNLNRAIYRARRIEETRRERATLPLGEFINGVEVLPFTLGHLNILFHARSPFFFGGPILIGDVGLFLWVVSPHYDHLNREVGREWRWWFWRVWMKLRRRPIPRIREVFIAQLLLHKGWPLFCRAINQYLDRTFMDRPPLTSGSKLIATSYTISILHKMMFAYKGGPEAIEKWKKVPMTVIFQLLKWDDVERAPKTPQFTPLQSRIELAADRIKARTSRIPQPATMAGGI